MRKLMSMAVILCVCMSSHAESTNLVIELADPPANVQRGFGWLQPEQNDDFSFVWMNHLEADVWVTLDSTAATEIEIRAVPYYHDRSQNLGLYVNGRWIGEWICSIHSKWRLETYTAKIPDGVLKLGQNRITLRASYRIGDEDRQYAVAVSRITLRRP